MAKDRRSYAHFAKLMSIDRGLPIFMAFEELNIRNLLYMQAEILEKREELLSLVYYQDPADQARPISDEEIESLQRAKMSEMRPLLKEYNEALLQQSKVSSLPRPRKYEIGKLHTWLFADDVDSSFLDEVEIQPYERIKSNVKDLVSVGAIRDFDIFSGFLRETIIPWLYLRIERIVSKNNPKPKDPSEYVVVSNETYLFVAKLLSILFATIFPAITIVALYFIPTMIARLVTVFGLSFIIAVVLAVFTVASPTEIFGLTAAAASVQVVFIGSTGFSGNGTSTG